MGLEDLLTFWMSLSSNFVYINPVFDSLRLSQHASLCHMKNNFHNKPIDLCTDSTVRMLLKAGMSKPILSEADREEVQQKHLEELVEIEER